MLFVCALPALAQPLRVNTAYPDLAPCLSQAAGVPVESEVQCHSEHCQGTGWGGEGGLRDVLVWPMASDITAHRLSVVQQPLAFRDQAHVSRFLASPLFQALADADADLPTGRVVGLVWYGGDHLFSSRPLAAPADFRGLILRAPFGEDFPAWATALGAEPFDDGALFANPKLPLAFVDVLDAATTGQPFIAQYRPGTVSTTPLRRSFLAVLVRDERWRDWPEARRREVRNFAEAAAKMCGLVRESVATTALEDLRSRGISPVPLDHTRLRAALRPHLKAGAWRLADYDALDRLN